MTNPHNAKLQQVTNRQSTNLLYYYQQIFVEALKGIKIKRQLKIWAKFDVLWVPYLPPILNISKYEQRINVRVDLKTKKISKDDIFKGIFENS